MASKTVALDSEAYELLRRQKRAEETFSDTVKRLARDRRPLSEFAGVWKDLTREERRDLDRVYSQARDADVRRSEKLRDLWGRK